MCSFFNGLAPCCHFFHVVYCRSASVKPAGCAPVLWFQHIYWFSHPEKKLFLVLYHTTMIESPHPMKNLFTLDNKIDSSTACMQQNVWCSSCQTVDHSDFVVASISVRSLQKLFVLIMSIDIYRIKVSQKYCILYGKLNTGGSHTICMWCNLHSQIYIQSHPTLGTDEPYRVRITQTRYDHQQRWLWRLLSKPEVAWSTRRVTLRWNLCTGHCISSMWPGSSQCFLFRK